MENDDLKRLLAPYRAEPRPGFSDRVMAHLQDGKAARPANRGWGWIGLGAELAGAVTALWLFAAALNLPEPAWFTQDQVLWNGQGTGSVQMTAVPDWMEAEYE